MDKLISTGHNLKMATLFAMVAGMTAAMPGASAFRMPSPKRVRNYPMPVISSPEEIAAWNEKVDQRNEARRQRRHAAWMASA